MAFREPINRYLSMHYCSEESIANCGECPSSTQFPGLFSSSQLRAIAVPRDVPLVT